MRSDEADRDKSGLFIGSEPLDGVRDRRAHALSDDDKRDGDATDSGDDDSTDSDTTDTDTTDGGDTGDTRDKDGKD
jgi:hypothetical protein